MRIHFRDEHYLCEEGNCINEQFTSAFKSEIDLKGKHSCADDPQTGAIYVDSVRQLWYETSTKWVELGMRCKGILCPVLNMNNE